MVGEISGECEIENDQSDCRSIDEINDIKAGKAVAFLYHSTDMPAPQYKYWILTIPQDKWADPGRCPDGITYCKGQLEIGEQGFEHWQLVAYVLKKCTYTRMISLWPTEAHIEHTRSEAAEDYVWKDESSLGSRFEYGKRPFKRNSPLDWEEAFENAKKAKFDDIPADVKVRCWNQFQGIAKYYLQPFDRGLVTSHIYWGVSDSGKTHRAKVESGYFDHPEDVYMKIPSTKFWDGYRGQKNVIIDEFEGQINIAHLKVWCDPSGTACQVEIKGGAVPLQATNFWITSNMDWRQWYTTPSGNDLDALKRRFNIVHFDMKIQ